MADLILTADFGNATLTGAPVLGDPTNTFGVRRADTQAIVIAAGTAMTPTAIAGQYQTTIANAVAGVTYQYHVQATVNGALISFPGDRTMSAATTLPSYLPHDAEADALAAELFGLTAYATATADDRRKARILASSRIDASRRWQGRKWYASFGVVQTLEFPRVDGMTLIDSNADGTDAIVPLNIKLATLHEANSILALTRDAQMREQHDGLKSEEIGTARKEYALPTTPAGVPLICLEADRLVDRYRLRSGRFL